MGAKAAVPEARTGGVVSPPAGVSPVLESDHDIADYIEALASEEVDREMIREFFRDGVATLERWKVASLAPGDPDANVRDERKEARYSGLPLETMPPLVIDEAGEVLDGNHRLRVLLAKGVEEAWCYVVRYPEDDEGV